MAKIICYTIWRGGATEEHEIILYQLENTNVYRNVIFKEELDAEVAIEFFSEVQIEGGRNVSRTVKCLNLDAIIAVGYRVNCKKPLDFGSGQQKY